VIQTPTPRLEIIRDELADYEWVAITPMLPSRQPPIVYRRGCLNPMLAEDATGKQLRLIRIMSSPTRKNILLPFFRNT
jgi:hypothetical protein